MHFTTLFGLVGMVASVSATITLGSQRVYVPVDGDYVTKYVAWIEGDNPCNTGKYTVVDPNGENGCDKWFTLANGQRYIQRGCGGQLQIYNGDGSFNSNCYGVSAWSCGPTTSKITSSYKCY